MKRAWLYLHAPDKNGISHQRENLTIHCGENDIEVIGETVAVREKRSDLDQLNFALKSAKESKCDYLAIHTSDTIEMDEQAFIAASEAYIECGLSLYSVEDGAFIEKTYRTVPMLKLVNAPNLFSIDEELEEGEEPEYPEIRGLPSFTVRVKRQGKICELSFTDMCETEQLFVLSCMSKEEIQALMMKLAHSMQMLGEMFDIRRDQDGQFTAKGKQYIPAMSSELQEPQMSL